MVSCTLGIKSSGSFLNRSEMIDPLAGMLWVTGASALLMAIYFARSLNAPVIQMFRETVQKETKQEAIVTNRSLLVSLGGLGALSLIQGVWMMDTWPLVGSYNILFGEIYAVFGLIVVSGAASALKGYSLKGLSYLGALAGVWGLADAYGILAGNLTSEPLVAAALYVSGALAGILSVPATHKPSRVTIGLLVLFLVLFAAASIFLGASASIEHLSSFSKYSP
jgi:putative membrane protein